MDTLRFWALLADARAAATDPDDSEAVAAHATVLLSALPSAEIVAAQRVLSKHAQLGGLQRSVRSSPQRAPLAAAGARWDNSQTPSTAVSSGRTGRRLNPAIPTSSPAT